MSKPQTPTSLFKVIAGLGLLTTATACGSDGGGGGPLESSLGFDEARSEVVVVLNRSLGGGETLHARVRSLADGNTLDCGSMVSEIPTFSGRGDGVYGGEAVTEDMFEDPASDAVLAGETPEQLQARLARTYFVDVCIEKSGEILHQARYSLPQALDQIGADGKFDADDDGVRIVSNSAYAQACEEELGPNPLFAPVEGSEGDYQMASCLDGTPIPTTIDGVPAALSDFEETRQGEGEYGLKCDKPQYIYSHCEPDARVGANGPRVQSARNDEGTTWVLLCRKSLADEGRYNDIAMIGTNPFTGKTCFFQNHLDGRNGAYTRSSDGTQVTWPGDTVASDVSGVGDDVWMTRPQGGEGSINCIKCHASEPLIHTPWIDGALNEDGTPVVPKMGQHPDFVEGYNLPYSLVDQNDQEWNIPRRLVSEEASACTKCHPITNDTWVSGEQHPNNEGCVGFACGNAPWLNRLVGADAGWAEHVSDSHQDFKNVFWMPPDAGEVLTEDDWDDSDYGAALRFILECGENPENPACIWEAAPTEPGDPTELPTIDATGEPLARAALAALGARYLDENNNEVEQTKRCAECHPVSRFGLEEWLMRTREAMTAGIDLTEDPDDYTEQKARDIVNFMRKVPENPDSVFAAANLGIFTAGVQFPYFRKLFDKAFGPQGAVQYAGFVARVSMPKGAHPPFSAEEFATVVKWFVDENLDNLEAILPEAPRPETCADVTAFVGLGSNGLPSNDSWFEGHLDDMEFEGWHATNVERGIDMFGCDGGDANDCFAGFEGVDVADGSLSGTRVIRLRDFDFNTSFWMRSSADGRFIGNGGGSVSGFGSTITDMVGDRNIGVRGSYDPGFFPNNDGFIMQGGAGLCGQSVLTNPALFEDGIDFTEPGCTQASGINLYQHVAVDLAGDYFIINSQFTSDSGSGNSDPSAGFGEGSAMKFSPLVFDGQDWDQKDAVDVASPYEGDSVLSPSGRLVISRFAGPDGQALGHMVRRVEATPSGGSYDIRINQPVRFICAPGAKSNISFDERYAVTHHYENGTANLFLTDLVTNNVYRITDMPADTKALFPHFRSDGWIYFLSTGAGGDAGMAINSALFLECLDEGTCEGTATPWDGQTGPGGGGGDAGGGGDTGGGDTGGDTGGDSSGGVPDAWTCPTQYFDADDGCDCGCGVADPDCGGATVESCEYCTEAGSCALESCDEIDPSDNTTCREG
ncbi:MAG: hypothetical protein ACE37F_15710 [Nannocystaceae bacterium]|nr:hypothetical protein [bacterium]